MKFVVAVVVSLLALAPARAKLEVAKVEAVHGMLGPERKSADIYPLDEVFFRYQVTGAKTDAEGKTDVEATMKLVNPNGKKVHEEKATVQRVLSLGGGAYTAYAVLTVPAPEKAPPGEYTLSVEIRDRIGMESARFDRKFRIKAPEFQIIVPRFSHDPDGKVPAAVGGMVGETIHFKLRVIGFDKSKKRVQATLTVRVVGEDGKEVTDKPRLIKAELNSPEEAAKATQVNFNGLLYLNRPGNFTLRLSVHDDIADKTTTFEAPLKVTAP